jgi:single-strand DNA-binding protein
MAGSVNRATILGHVGKDPEVRNTQSGMKIVTLSIATSETWNDKSTGERKEQTEWHRVVVMNERLADLAEKYVRKGSKIYIEGKIQTRKWTDRENVERYTTEIVLGLFNSSLVLLSPQSGEGSRQDDSHGQRGSAADGGRERDHGNSRQSGYGQGARVREPALAGAGAGGWNTGRGSDLDDDIPF